MSELTKLQETASQRTILYIDKDKALQKNFGIYLNKTFAKLFQAYNGEEGLKLFKETKPDIVITDLQLDVLDAIEMIAEMQEFLPKANLIVVSKDCDNYQLLQNIDMGIKCMLLKPIAFSTLAKKIREFLPSPVKVDKKPKVVSPIIPKKVEKVSKVIKQPTPPKIKTTSQISCIQDIKNLYSKNTSMLFINYYKGIPIQNNGSLESCADSSFKVRLNISQIIALKYEKQTIIEIEHQDKHKYIQAKLINIDIKNTIVTLVNPHYINYKYRDSGSSRIVVDKSFKATIFYENNHIDLDTSIISSSSAVFFVNNKKFNLGVGEIFDLTLGFDLNSPSSMIKEKKFTKIFAKSKVIRIDKQTNGSNIIVSLEIQKAGQNTFKKYLQQREMEIIQEFKRRLRA